MSEPVRRRLRTAPARIRSSRLGRRLFGPPKPITRTVSATISGGGSVSIRGRAQFALLRKHDTTAAVAELEQRTLQLSTRIADLGDRHADDVAAMTAQLRDLREEIRVATSELRSDGRRIAAGGIRLEAVGLLLVASGTVLQAIA